MRTMTINWQSISSLENTWHPNPVWGILLGKLGQLVLHSHSASVCSFQVFHILPPKKSKPSRVHQVLQTARRLCSIPGLLKASVAASKASSKASCLGWALTFLIVIRIQKAIHWVLWRKQTKNIQKRHNSHIHFTVEITVRPWCGNPIVDVPILGVGEQRMLPPCRFPELLHWPINLWMTPERSVEFLSCDLSTNCCAWLLKKSCFCMFPKTYQQKLVQCSCSCQVSFLFSIGRKMSWNAPLCLHP